MKISIITVVYNNVNYIESNILSIHKQSHRNIQHIVIDGGSTDGTIEYLKGDHGYPIYLVSEPDDGIYDAMNKGINLAEGEIIGFLNSDDIYASDNMLEKIVSTFDKSNTDSIYGDLEYVDSSLKNTVRTWKSGEYHEGIMQNGWMPPHPAFFVRKSVYDAHGNFDNRYKISADYELMLRFLEKHKITTKYLPEVIVKMRTGGRSYKPGNYLQKYREDLRAMHRNNIRNPLLTLIKKNLSKIPQFF